MTAIERLKIAKSIEPKIFHDSTPQVHIDVLNFLAKNDKRQCLSAFRGFGKTTLLHAVYSPTYALNSQKDEYIKIFSQTSAKAKEFLSKSEHMIANFCSLFGLKKTKRGFINLNGREIVYGISGISQDTRGDSINSIRPSLVICDDIESNAFTAVASSKTKIGREKIKYWFFSELIPALSADGRLIVIGTILHNDSLIANLLEDKDFSSMKIPLITQDNKSAWPSRFPLTKKEAKELSAKKQKNVTSIEEIKESFALRGMEDEFHQEYLCSAVSEENRLFKQESFAYFDNVVYEEKGYRFSMQDSINQTTLDIVRPKGVIINNNFVSLSEFYIVSAMDLASDGSDETTIVTCGLYQGSIYVLSAIGGYWNPFLKVANVLYIAKTFSPAKFGIEKANAQNDFFYIAKNASIQYQTALNVVPLLHGGRAKNLRIAQLQPYFATKRIYFNRSDPNTQKIEFELLDFVLDSESKKDNYIDSLAYMLQLYYGIGLKVDKKNKYIKDPYSL